MPELSAITHFSVSLFHVHVFLYLLEHSSRPAVLQRDIALTPHPILADQIQYPYAAQESLSDASAHPFSSAFLFTHLLPDGNQKQFEFSSHVGCESILLHTSYNIQPLNV